MKQQQFARIKALRDKIRAEKLAAFLVLTPVNRFYLSGFSGTDGALLIPAGSTAKLFVDGRYTERAQRESSLAVRDIQELETALKDLRGKKVGIEDAISVRELQKLRKQYRGVRWQVTSNVVEEVRQQKDRQELASIKKGSVLIDQAFHLVRRRVVQKQRGVTEIELAWLIERFGREHGASGVSFEPIVAWGRNSASPHHASSTQKIGANNFLLLDFGFTVDGYQSDFTRTLFLGKPSHQQREVYEIVREAQALGIEAVTAGEKAAEVDNVVRDYITGQGYGDYFPHSTGHGVGLEIHELPNISHTAKSTLLTGEVVTIEPGIYLLKKYGVRIEDMVVVDKKPKVLSTIPRDFVSMIIKSK